MTTTPAVETWTITATSGRFDVQTPDDLDVGECMPAYCVVTDTEVLGPYPTWEAAQSLLDEGVAGDVYPLTYR